MLPDRTVLTIACAIAWLGFAAGCGAADESTGPRMAPGSPVTGAGGNGTGAGAGAVVAGNGAGAGSSGATGFGNPTGPAPVVGDPSAGGAGAGSGCLEATVAFVVDGSGSMCETFGASTRWQELRGALLDPTRGLIYRLQGLAKFGLLIYDGSIDLALAGMATGGSPSPACAGGGTFGRTMGTECMQVVSVPPAKGNADAIAQAFPTRELGGSTPTDRAMNQAVDQLIAAQMPGVDLARFPQYVILATDGQPNDICIGGLGGDGMAQQQGVIAAVDRAAAASIKTIVVSLAGGDPALQAHLDEVARHGNPADPAAHTFTPVNPDELVAALTEVLGSALGCAVE